METEPTNKDLKEFKSNLKFGKVDLPTYVVLLVVHDDYEQNNVTRLSCKKLIPLEGYPQTKMLPVGGYVYDSTTDSYVVNCIDYLSLGYIPFSFKATIENTGLWSSIVPMPEAMIRRYLPTQQKNDMDRFKAAFANESVKFSFIQFAGTA